MKLMLKCLLGIIFVFNSQTAFAQMGNVDTRHISDKSFCVVRMDVARLISQLDADKSEFQKLAKMLEEETQMDISNIKVLTIQFGDSDVHDREPSFAATFEMAKGFEQQKFLGKIGVFQELTEATRNGKQYLKPDEAAGPHFYFESKQKFTVATRGAMESILDLDSDKGKIAAKVRSAPPGSEFTAVFSRTTKYSQSTSMFTEEFGFVPLPFGIVDFIKDAKSGEGYINIQSGTPVRVKIEFQSADVAGKAKKVVDQYVALGKSLIPPTRASLKKQIEAIEDDDDFAKMQKDSLQVGLRALVVAEKIVGGAACEKRENQIELKVTQMGGLKELPNMFFDGFRLLVIGNSQSAPKSAIDGVDKADNEPIDRVKESSKER